ncbi:methylated-DNA--[protein]-cysteine S-methyltransferase [Methanococcoides orientis]|uniref:methylated-DNA--[protein]-cysteine S-methyltransferase n=1 Tax=Methanococcoides orientis TaxID=2822137 RepID=UPI001E3018F7|nr:methylated-DNA--[protein]-cysteine S-methyltransferase [Methanococcoides orientis]UGV40777.1 methylated-DNA--[protein]-cysteine S-methyltransferase [Methanococcoides orientis]
MYYDLIRTKLGTILLAGDSEGLKVLNIQGGKRKYAIPSDWKQNSAFFKAVKEQLDRYLAGELKKFDVELSPEGSDFQKKVWNALTKIPYGKAVFYGHVAEMIGNPKASRAVGHANSLNPIQIIIPCHRVVSSNGKLAGYAGGLDVMVQLLEIEGIKTKDNGSGKISIN